MASPFLRAAQSAIKAATALGATKAATLRRVTSVYAPATGTNETVTTDYAWTGVLESYVDLTTRGGNALAGGVVGSDQKFTGAAADVPVDPTPETDKLIIDNVAHAIVNAKTDPAGALWVLQVRR
ncbi:MAG: hypothetical protein NUW22_10820 [Acidobacteria bacterium]|nr:hypothetical protein [Acidobacteriota bacterium]